MPRTPRTLVAVAHAASLLLVTLAAASAMAHPEDQDRVDAPWPQEECLSAGGKTACGYACVAAYGDVRCAAVPWGACHAAYGQIVCGPGRDVAEPPGRRWRLYPKATCLAAAGRIACGWGCVAGSDGPVCSPAIGGVCAADAGKVVCSEGGIGPFGAPPVCRAAHGKVACGWSCVAAYGDVRCAAHFDGRCEAAYGQITCSDGGGQRRAPRQECRSAYGKTACGYSCVSAYGDVRCASRPSGRCVAAHGSITCSD